MVDRTGMVSRFKKDAKMYKYVEGIGLGGFAFENQGQYWKIGPVPKSVKCIEGRFTEEYRSHMNADWGSWVKVLLGFGGTYKYFFETEDGVFYDDSDVEWIPAT